MPFGFVGTQIDGLGHVTTGDDNHWYNGFTEAEWGGNFGIRKCDAASIPPIVTRGVLIDVAGFRKVDALPSHYRITASELKAALEHQGTQLRPGDTVLIRTGTLRYWGANGADHEKIGRHDSAGIDLPAARWLVEQQGAILIASDTSGLEQLPGPNEKPQFIPVHNYLLIEQGVHIGEFHFLEDLSRDGVYEFCAQMLDHFRAGPPAVLGWIEQSPAQRPRRKARPPHRERSHVPVLRTRNIRRVLVLILVARRATHTWRPAPVPAAHDVECMPMRVVALRRPVYGRVAVHAPRMVQDLRNLPERHNGRTVGGPGRSRDRETENAPNDKPTHAPSGPVGTTRLSSRSSSRSS